MQHTEIFQLISEHYVLSFFLLMSTLWTADKVLSWPFRLINRWIRHRNIVAHGWPPDHLDADGDFKPEPKHDR